VNYVVTAINKLSGEREVISNPRPLDQIELLLKNHLEEIRYKRYQPWTDYKIEEASSRLLTDNDE
jgi:hypothetical protein